MSHIIVFGNEKGGSGKSTTAMHVATALVRMGHRVGAVDLDLRQSTLGRYLRNRDSTQRRTGRDLALPRLGTLPETAGTEPGQHPQEARLAAAIAALEPHSDFVVVDCPGAHTRLAQLAHALADTLVTPLNDSFVDLDLLAETGADGEVLGPSIYTRMVARVRGMRAEAGLDPVDWIVARNRLSGQEAPNKDRMTAALQKLSREEGFRLASGFSERVIFRELFPQGLTLLDLTEEGAGKLSISAVAARQELRDLVAALDLPGVEITF